MTDRERYVAAYTERYGRPPRETPEFTPRQPQQRYASPMPAG